VSEREPGLQRAFEALREESSPAPRPEAMAAARAAMHQARTVELERTPLQRLGRRVGAALTVHRLMAGGTGLAAGVAVVALLGWNAPAGSPLHGVRVAHEQIALVLPGSDRAGLDLGYAESRLEQAQRDGSTAALDEAQRLLDDAHAHLSAGSALWPRWERDEKLLGELRHDDGEGGSDGGSDSGSGGTQSTSTSSDGGDHEGGTSTQSSSSTSEHEGGTTSSEQSQATTTTTTTRESSTSSTSDGGGGGSSSTSSSTSGGGGGDSPGGGGSTSSSSTTSGGGGGGDG